MRAYRQRSFHILFLLLAVLRRLGCVVSISCNEYVSPNAGESVTNPNWGFLAAAKAVRTNNSSNPYFLCFSALATYGFSNGSSLGFAVFGGVPSNELNWYNGAGGKLKRFRDLPHACV